MAIRDNYRLMHTYESESRRLRTWIKENFSPRDYYNLLGFVNRTSQTAYQKKSDNLFKKFSHLHFKYKQKNAIRPQGSQSSSKPKVGRVLINLSDHPLSDSEKSLLEKGPGYAITQKRIPDKEIKVALENFGRKLVVRDYHPLKPSTGTAAVAADPPFYPNSWYFPVQKNARLRTLLLEFGFKVKEILSKAQTPRSNISKSEREAIKTLRGDKSVITLVADKGNATVIMNRSDYIEKMDPILNDTAHFKKIDSDPTPKWEKALNKFLLNKLRKPGLIKNKLYRFLRSSDSRTPKLYGLPKVHKEGVPLRPIVSAVRTFSYNVGKLLVWILGPYMTDCDSYVKNSAEFASFLASVKPGYSRQASFDVKSLFTNVPVNEAVDLALELIDRDDNARFPLPSNHLRKLFEFATSHCAFQFEDSFYLQIDGLSMGNPLAPPLAHLFMIKIEKRALNIGLRIFLTWKRYVDDIYVRLRKRDFLQLDNITERLNQVHPSIEFTAEPEEAGRLNFLQVSIQKETGNHSEYSTSVYRKPTHTNLYLRWDSAHPDSQKLGSFHSLLWNAKRICSSLVAYKKEKQFLLALFRDDMGYPENRLLHIIYKVEHPLAHPKPKKEGSIPLVPPYVKGVSEKIARAWKTTAREHGLKQDTTVGYQAMSKLKSLLVKPYSPDPPGQCIYSAVCKKCGESYLGETGLSLSTRLTHHSRDKNSAVKRHQCGFDSFEWKMIARSHNTNERKIYESILIRESQPVLNRNLGVDPYVFV